METLLKDIPAAFKQLDDWYQQPLGQLLSAAVSERLDVILSQLFGYHLLQLGLPSCQHWLDSSPIPHKLIMLPGEEAATHRHASHVYGHIDALPFASASTDVVILPHTLAFNTPPEAIIAEVERILVPEGHLITIGFNPVSLWGLSRQFLKFKHTAPWSAPFISTMKLHRHFERYGMTMKHLDSFFFRPPLAGAKNMENLLFLETIGRSLWPYPGGAYIAIAQKQVSRLTPIKPIWQFRNIIIGKRSIQYPTVVPEKNSYSKETEQK